MTKKVFNLIIVDESGSMSIIREQALAGMNETLETIIKMQELHKDLEQRVSLLTFDSNHCRFIFDNVGAANTHKLGQEDYRPSAATPLYDAIGIGISKTNAVASTDDNVLVTIITDGMENCSKEYNLRMIKNLIDKLKKQNWTFAFIGTDNLDVEGMAKDMGIANAMKFRQTDKGTKEMFRKKHSSLIDYCGRIAKGEHIADGSYFDE